MAASAAGLRGRRRSGGDLPASRPCRCRRARRDASQPGSDVPRRLSPRRRHRRRLSRPPQPPAVVSQRLPGAGAGARSRAVRVCAGRVPRPQETRVAIGTARLSLDEERLRANLVGTWRNRPARRRVPDSRCGSLNSPEVVDWMAWCRHVDNMEEKDFAGTGAGPRRGALSRGARRLLRLFRRCSPTNR